MDPGYLDRTPSVDPPPGREPNFTDPESRSHQLYILIAVLSPIVFIVGSLRIYSRLRITRSFGADDWICIAATILTLSYSALILKLLWKPGGGIIGIHFWDVPISHYIEYEKGALADYVLFRIAHTTTKVGFLVFYLRLFRPVSYVRFMVWAGISVVITFCVVNVVVPLVACSPWPSEHGDWIAPSLIDRCYPISINLRTAAAYFSVITDFYVWFIPLHQIPSLGLSPRRKVGVSLVFLTGLLATGAALASLIIRQDKKLFDLSDFSWTIVPVYATSIVEINVGLICLSLPIIFVQFVGRFTNLSKSVRSWIRERRSHHQSSNESSPNLTPSDNVAPHIPSVQSDTGLSGMRSFPDEENEHSAERSSEGILERQFV
ncbi:hypothetical protein F4813DRAFT_348130 [Daldinia decipiens]|uniref:uncharacterized protein n=1 Tax=Daldinia decipiens TaxID=326647 RepID=UPI0020C3019C|nr:uncharacterized protein F4813DRAFT_348130 [Daldinia decipiens]KAI1660722.1 hypothetical protein F4813DRAFT_348130 [Daldinia decipiens]